MAFCIGAFLYDPDSPAAKELNAMLKNNPIAQSEVAASTNFWVLNGMPSMSLLDLTERCYSSKIFISLTQIYYLSLLLIHVARLPYCRMQVAEQEHRNDRILALHHRAPHHLCQHRSPTYHRRSRHHPPNLCQDSCRNHPRIP